MIQLFEPMVNLNQLIMSMECTRSYVDYFFSNKLVKFDLKNATSPSLSTDDNFNVFKFAFKNHAYQLLLPFLKLI